MRNRQVPRAEWFPFFAAFTRRHLGSPATVRVIDPKLGAQVEARDLPLAGIVVDAGGKGPISILLARGTDANVEHPVDAPEQVWVELTESGAEAALEIESVGGMKTILEFRGTPAGEAGGGRSPAPRA